MLNRDRIRPVLLIGAGSIGSYVALALAKAGVPDITVYDPDVVESHNIPMSLYRERDIGRLKVHALTERIADETSGKTVLTMRAERFTSQPIGRCSLIACIDVMEQGGGGRIPLFARITGSVGVDLYIDTRINRWFGEIYTIVPTSSDDCQQYQQTLLPDSEMVRQTCGYHGISSMSMAVAGDAVNALFRYWNEGAHVWRGSRRYDRLPTA